MDESNDFSVIERRIFDNGVFYVVAECLKNGHYYVSLFDWQPQPSEEEKIWEPLKVSQVTVYFDVKVFPHIPIVPANDYRFKEQYWATKTKTTLSTMAYVAIYADQETYLDILHYVDKISKMKAFL
jgi:hypothetical protein